MIRYTIFILLTWCSILVFSQERVYRNYTVEDGLPSSEVYFSFQDSKGYMWFATDGGVCRFNGYEFEVFNTENGLTDNTIFRITEDARGRIWFAPFNGRFCYYDNGKIHKFKHNDKLSDLKGMARLASFYVDSIDNIWIGAQYYGIQKIDSEGNIKQVINLGNEEGVVNRQIKVEKEYVVGSLLKDQKASVFVIGDYSVVSTFEGAAKSCKQDLKKIAGNRGVYKLCGDEVNMMYLERQNLVWANNNGQIICEHLELLKENDGIFLGVYDSVFYLGVENQGVFKYQLRENKLEKQSLFLKGESVAHVCKDNQGGLWFSSLSNGIYYLANEAISKNQKLKSSIYDIEVDTIQAVTYVATRDGGLYEISDSVQFINQLQRNALNIAFDYRKKKLMWTLIDGKYDGLTFYNQQDQKKVINFISETPNSFKDALIEKDTIYFANHLGFNAYYKKGNAFYTFYTSYSEKKNKKWCTSLLNEKRKIWVGTNKGVLVYDKDEKTINTTENQFLSSSAITCLERLNENTFLIGTKTKGVLFIENGKLSQILNDSIGLPSNLIRTIHVDNKGIIWIGTTKGVSKVILKPNHTMEVSNLSRNHGLISEEITCIKSFNDTLYIGTAKGLLTINRKWVKVNKLAPETYIKNIFINSVEKPKDSLQELVYTENNVSIKYESLNYRSQGLINYQYRLLGEGLDTNWVRTQSRIARYTLLPSGIYLFEVKAKNEDGFWSLPQQISFTIHPPFWRTWWFILIMIIVGGGIIYFFLYAYFKRREKELMQEQEKVAVEKKLVELELRALRSQMNPHFIFNILNSIQHFMLHNNFKETNRYLTQFARLIRSVLNVSEKKYISIGEELDMLRLYMNLEKMRFENGFDYEIIIDEEIDEDYDEIPSMLIQPYVENAIWHGLMNKKTKGKIIVKVYLKNNSFFCTIEDNGIGIKEAAKIKAKRKNMKHKSVGMRITKDRLDIINKNEGVNVSIVDLNELSPKQTGTKVTIQIKT